MGDFGPSFAASAGAALATEYARCSECSVRMPAGIMRECSFCGGTLVPERSAGSRSHRPAAARTPPAAPAAPPALSAAEVEVQAAQIMQAILPTELLESLSSGHSKPTDETVLEELPLVKIEPYVLLRVVRRPQPPPASIGRRELFAEAAERRRGAEGTNAHAAEAAPATEEPVEVPGADEQTPTSPPAAAAAPEVLELECRATASAFGTPLAELTDGVNVRAATATHEQPP